MSDGVASGFSKRCRWRLGMVVLLTSGFMILGQGCTEMDTLIQETQREHKLEDQMEWAEGELRLGNVLSSRSVFEWVSRESKSPSLQQRAQFFSAFTTLLDRKDKNRWERSYEMFGRTHEEFPEGDLGQISQHISTALTDVVDIVSAKQALEQENASIRRQIGLVSSKARDMDHLVEKQKQQLSKIKVEMAALKDSIRLKNDEIKSLELKIQKLEEIHKEIKEKREGLS